MFKEMNKDLRIFKIIIEYSLILLTLTLVLISFEKILN
jgi:hypothetical protein